MMTRTPEVTQTIRKSVIQALEKQNHFMNAVVNTLSEMVVNLVRQGGKTGKNLIESVSEIISIVVYAIVETRGNMEEAVKALVFGVLRGLSLTGEEIMSVISILSATIIKCVAKANGDMKATAKGLIKAVFQGAKSAGANTQKAIVNAANGAIAAAYEIDETTGDRVKQVICQTIDELNLDFERIALLKDDLQKIELEVIL